MYGESIIDSLDETASSCCLIMTHLLDEAIFFGIVLKLIGWHLIYKSDNEWLFRKNNCLCPFWIFAGMTLLFSPDNNVDNQDRDIFQFLVWYDVSNVTFLIQIVQLTFPYVSNCLEYQFIYIVFHKNKMPSYFIPRKHR